MMMVMVDDDDGNMLCGYSDGDDSFAYFKLLCIFVSTV